MEFFEELEKSGVDIEALKNLLQISALPSHCRSIDSVIYEDQNGGEIYCLWGQFNVSRELIKNGVRFALLNCPHALAWTITYQEERAMLVVHCTIDDREVDTEFTESILLFISDWRFGLSNAFPEIT